MLSPVGYGNLRPILTIHLKNTLNIFGKRKILLQRQMYDICSINCYLILSMENGFKGILALQQSIFIPKINFPIFLEKMRQVDYINHSLLALLQDMLGQNFIMQNTISLQLNRVRIASNQGCMLNRMTVLGSLEQCSLSLLIVKNVKQKINPLQVYSCVIG